MLVFNKHWMICKNGKNVARVIIKRSDMKYAENPRKSDETPECTICLWSGYEPLSDWPQNQAAGLKHEMRSMLVRHLQNHPHDYSAKLAMQEDTLHLLYTALQQCDDFNVQLLAVKKVGDRYTLLKVDDPEFADGLIYAARTDTATANFHNRREETRWKKAMDFQLQAEIHAYDLYLRGSVFDVIVEYWIGDGDAKEHLEDGVGFDHENQTGIYFEMFDPYDKGDVRAIEQQICDLFL